MNLDIRTLSIVLSITVSLQIIIMLMQYLINKAYKGIGWWLAGYILIAAGVIFLPLREIPSLEKTSIIANNVLQISGMLAVYIGINVFLNRKQNLWIIVLIPVLYYSGIVYFTIAENNISIRVMIHSTGASVVSFLICYSIFSGKNRMIAISANFIFTVFFIKGVLFLCRLVVTIIYPADNSFFVSTPAQEILFVASIVLINLWMSGLIIMINQRLNADNIEAREHFEMIFNDSPDAAIISRIDDSRIINTNESFTHLSGLSREEVLGRTTSDIGVWTDKADMTKLKEVLSKKGIYENVEVDFTDKNGNLVSGLVSAKKFNLHGTPLAVSVVRDITLRKKIENKLIEAIDEAIRQKENAEKANNEKALLLKEVHHRIKNNMNTIIGLLSIQSDSMNDPSAIEALQVASNRVRSMMVLYDKLYRSEGFVEISIREYLSPLINEIAGSFPQVNSVRIEKNISDITINTGILFPLGIIVNELITNIMKYAFTGRTDGKITVSAVQNDNQVSVVIQDNGIGLPGSLDIKHSTGFGLQLVSMLTGQIGGNVQIERENGTRFTISFNLQNS